MWNVVITDKAKKQMAKLDHQTQTRILNFLYKEDLQNLPKSLGKALVGNFKGLWRYGVGDYRIICEIKNRELVVLVVDVGHRDSVYKV